MTHEIEPFELDLTNFEDELAHSINLEDLGTLLEQQLVELISADGDEDYQRSIQDAIWQVEKLSERLRILAHA